jgi:8-oxo-dGTP diphosphatase
MKYKRATIIVENENGILLTRISHEPWMLPGGKANHNEPRIIAAIRELYEETRLKTEEIKFLFDFESRHCFHKVFLVSTLGEPIPSNEVSKLIYHHPTIQEKSVPLDEISRSSAEMIMKYLYNKFSK